MTTAVHTATGTCRPAELGLTLMHEHLIIGWPGWESDTVAPPFDRREAKRLCVDRMLELKELGVSSLVDPCPIDLGRDVEFAAEVSQASGVHIVCATGLYKEESGAAAYYKFRGAFTDAVSEMTEIFVNEVTEGIGSTGIKAGVIKVATGPHQITPYERSVIIAAARAHKATGAPITTHTDEGTMGREQLAILSEEGVDPKRVVIGHSCGSADLRYHTDMLDCGAYLGFDRFGLELLHPTASASRHSSACSASASRSRSSSRTTPFGAGAADRCRYRPNSWPLNGIRAIFSSTSFRPCAKPASPRRRSMPCWLKTPGGTSSVEPFSRQLSAFRSPPRRLLRRGGEG
jgi:phosphotriesterase-related protein